MSSSFVLKNAPDKKELMGQFMTPPHVVDFCLKKTKIKSASMVIEPSCGEGVFLDKIRNKRPKGCMLGIEADSVLLKNYLGEENVENINFYDFQRTTDKPIHFIGNPPFRSPAHSLTTHYDYVRGLARKYNVVNAREEAVFWLIKTVDLLEGNGQVSYILPRAIFRNNSNSNLTFISFLKNYLNLKHVWDLDKVFSGVARDLVYCDFEANKQNNFFYMNNIKYKIIRFYSTGPDYIPFQRMFKKTHLGSVPCESIFLSIQGETRKEFMSRLTKLFSAKLTEKTLIDHLSHNGQQHLEALKKRNINKIKTIIKYIYEIKETDGYDSGLFSEAKHFKPIQHRHKERWYFRHPFLKKCSFVYILNSNPCKSFYFPGNPSKDSTDYFGYCRYDVNRNSGPGANRTIPVDTLKENVTDEFKAYWADNTGLPLEKIFDYMIYVSKSDWYKNMKKEYERFYFGVPKEFMQEYLS